MKTLKDIDNLQNKKVLVRVDFNVPIRDRKVTDDFRIKAVLPTIEYLRSRGAIVILISHIESISGENVSLRPVADHLNKLGVNVSFLSEVRPPTAGDCFLLENLRFFKGEKNNDPEFAQELAGLADIYVNDAFSVCHREHASIVSVPKYIPAYAGLQLEREITNLSKAFNPVHPFLFILGGAKFETKLPLIERFSKEADIVFIGGALANDALKVKGFPVGVSKISHGDLDISELVNRPNIMIPTDVVVQSHVGKSTKDVGSGDCILDAGPETMTLLKREIELANFVLWNGPLGLYEDGYQGATLELAKMIAEKSRDMGTGFISIIGGGDTVAAVSRLGVENDFTFVSTGGGAMLEFLAKGTLPGIEAVSN